MQEVGIFKSSQWQCHTEHWTSPWLQTIFCIFVIVFVTKTKKELKIRDLYRYSFYQNTDWLTDWADILRPCHWSDWDSPCDDCRTHWLYFNTFLLWSWYLLINSSILSFSPSDWDFSTISKKIELVEPAACTKLTF